jgi:WD40 repeat protein
LKPWNYKHFQRVSAGKPYEYSFKSSHGKVRLIGHTNYLEGIAFSPDSKTLISSSDDNTLKLWDVTTGQELRTFSGHTKWGHDVAFSPDGKTVVSANSDGTVKLWDVTTGQVLRNFTGHKGQVLAVAFSPDGRWAASGGDDGVIKLWWAVVE